MDPDYHAWKHGLGLADITLALRACHTVVPDERAHKGFTRPNAYRADCFYLLDQEVRVDFNLAETPTGDLILVVTAFPRRSP